jgi:hypothetical protein
MSNEGGGVHTVARPLNTRHDYCYKIAQNPKSSWSIWRSPAKLGRWEVGTEYCLCLLSFEFVVPLAGKPDARCPHLKNQFAVATLIVQRDTKISVHSVPRTHKIQ